MITAYFYDDQDQEGARFSATLRNPDSRYHRIWESGFDRHDLDEDVSSIRVTASADEEKGGELILFWENNFLGAFWRFPVNANGRYDKDYLGQHMNDEATSALIVRRSLNEEIVSFRSLNIGPVLTNALVQLPDLKPELRNIASGIAPNGDPVYTWDMWPRGRSNLDSDERYVKIEMPLLVDTPGGANDSVRIQFWVHIDIGSDRRLKATIPHSDVEAGGLTGSAIVNALRPHIRNQDLQAGILLKINAALQSRAENVKKLYFLPGDGESLWGNAITDIALVLVK